MTTNEYARRTTTPLTWILISGLIAIGMGCASAGVTPMAGSTDPGMLPRPGVLYVYDFAVGPEDVMVDSLGAEFMSEGEKLTKEEKTAYATAEAFSVALVGELRKEGINAQRINRGAVPALHSIVLKGQFVTIDTGSRFKRMVIGFGAGSSELRARVQAYQATARGLHRLVEAEAVAKGSKMPGMAVPVAGGAAMGSVATSAVISGGMNIAKETKGAMNPDAQRMAKKIAARAKAFYVRQGWL
ncbi:MAG: DUF4410 domain-containing protein [Deltaproteobacteria bacterium]|nr:DUF4410 domain-containing protein [Deltaproteobacteria bacterium]MBW2691715.1 DUF4410 domain-containing protein [Deltaproteobacteria bacterium]